ncbi:1015_t:CDS:2 [Funneliformis caledonium]|uniref:1015_t:CDS:1 n=1 Tax=Funneliformis caledonium TaxID=1117310 RepID=A0A9N8Z7I1_9GLOM|nr:1015_t:CDS:2 [Funneliformis caledonium]
MTVENKHLKNVRQTSYLTNCRKLQIAVEILACACENFINELFEDKELKDQIIYIVHIIFTYITFYKAIISSKYLYYIGLGLTQEQSVVIQR